MPRALLLAAVLPVLAACGKEGDEPLPAACRASPEEVRAALLEAPEPVRLDGVSLSDCLNRDADAADVQAVGATFLAVAAGLASAADEDPKGSAALRLGYLVGAVRRGAEGTSGIHGELVRRLEQEARRADSGSMAFTRGERAGRRSG